MCAVLTVIHVLVRVKCFITVERLYGLFCDIIILYIHAFGVMLSCFIVGHTLTWFMQKAKGVSLLRGCIAHAYNVPSV